MVEKLKSKTRFVHIMINASSINIQVHYNNEKFSNGLMFKNTHWNIHQCISFHSEYLTNTTSMVIIVKAIETLKMKSTPRIYKTKYTTIYKRNILSEIYCSYLLLREIRKRVVWKPLLIIHSLKNIQWTFIVTLFWKCFSHCWD